MQPPLPELRSASPDATPLFALADAIPDMVWIAHSGGTPAYRNRAWNDYVGRAPRSGNSDDWTDVVHPDDVEATTATWREARQTGRACEGEARCRRHDAAYRWFRYRANPVTAPTGTISDWVIVLADVHLRSCFQAELELSARRREEFLGALAHDIRNPLQALNQALYVIRLASVAPDTVHRMHDLMERQLSLVSSLTDTQLDFTKLRWSTTALVPSDSSVGAFVGRVTEAASPLLAERGQQLEVRVDAPACAITVDVPLLTQATSHLLLHSAFAAVSVQLQARSETGFLVLAIGATDGQVAPGHGTSPVVTSSVVTSSVVTSSVVGSPQGRGVADGDAGITMARHVATLHGGTLDALHDASATLPYFTLRVPLVLPPRR
ncbi:MAG: PAS domain-containing protein [Gemmatimonadaceae bacterium]